MIRVVIDTNILVSALLQPESLPAAVLMLALSGEVQLCVSDAVFAEYDEVIRRPHLKRTPDVIEGTFQCRYCRSAQTNRELPASTATYCRPLTV